MEMSYQIEDLWIVIELHIKKNQKRFLELKNTIPEIKKSLVGLNGNLNGQNNES
jgi:hypothetical protein